MSLSTPFIHRPIATMLLTLGLALVGAAMASCARPASCSTIWGDIEQAPGE